jgi:hypothetical protein
LVVYMVFTDCSRRAIRTSRRSWATPLSSPGVSVHHVATRGAQDQGCDFSRMRQRRYWPPQPELASWDQASGCGPPLPRPAPLVSELPRHESKRTQMQGPRQDFPVSSSSPVRSAQKRLTPACKRHTSSSSLVRAIARACVQRSDNRALRGVTNRSRQVGPTIAGRAGMTSNPA